MSDDTPMKSAYELAMERLRKRDEEAGAAPKRLTDAQKAEIAEIRTIFRAKLAELEILQQDKLRTTSDPGERLALEDEYRRERERITADQDAQVARVTAG